MVAQSFQCPIELSDYKLRLVITCHSVLEYICLASIDLSGHCVEYSNARFHWKDGAYYASVVAQSLQCPIELLSDDKLRPIIRCHSVSIHLLGFNWISWTLQLRSFSHNGSFRIRKEFYDTHVLSCWCTKRYLQKWAHGAWALSMVSLLVCR